MLKFINFQLDTEDKQKIIELMKTIVDLKHDSIHNYNSNGADWHTCRLCYASKDEIRGEYQEIEHYSDCPGTIAQEILDKLYDEV